MDSSEAGRFIILFKSAFGRFDFKAIYAIETKHKRIVLIFSFGKAPIELKDKMIKGFYRYKNSTKEFTEIV